MNQKKTCDLKVFENPEFGTIRTVEIDGELWLVGKDVAEALGYSNTKDALITHVDDEDKRLLQRSEIATFENYIPKTALPVNFAPDDIPNRGLTIINESGLYSLVLSSKLPNAKKFRRWVTSEVLPSIRRHGAYMTPETIEAVLLNPDTIIRLAAALKEEQEKRRDLELENARQKSEIALMEPKVRYHDVILQCEDLVPISLIAKDYGWSAIQMNRCLNEKRVQYRRGSAWVLYQKYAGCGYTGSKTHEFKDGGGKSHAKMQTYWTQKGRLFLYELLKKDGILPMIEREYNNDRKDDFEHEYRTS